MAIDPDLRRTRARQVGLLMQAYRRAHAPSSGRRGLSQEGLLDLMGQADPGYLNRYDRSTVSRWESGATLPTRERLEVFGRALDLSPDEIDGLVLLSGLGADNGTGPIPETDAPSVPAAVSGAVSDDVPEHPGYAGGRGCARWERLPDRSPVRGALPLAPLLSAGFVRRPRRLLHGITGLELPVHAGDIRRRSPVWTDGTGTLATTKVR